MKKSRQAVARTEKDNFQYSGYALVELFVIVALLQSGLSTIGADIKGAVLFSKGQPSVNAAVAPKAAGTNGVAIRVTGRPVIGKLVIPKSLANSPDQLSPPSERRDAEVVFLVTNKTEKYAAEAMICFKSGQEFGRMASDGTFRFEVVTTGSSWLLAKILSFPIEGGTAKTIAVAAKRFDISASTGDRSSETVDLGLLDPVMVHEPQVGETASLFEVKTVDGGTFNLADHLGKYVLLDFENLTSPPRLNESVQATWSEFKANKKLVMLTLHVPPTGGSMYWPNTSVEYPWSLANLMPVPWYELQILRASYGLQCDRSIYSDPLLPIILLIGPDGKIVARDLTGNELKTAVTQALAGK